MDEKKKIKFIPASSSSQKQKNERLDNGSEIAKFYETVVGGPDILLRMEQASPGPPCSYWTRSKAQNLNDEIGKEQAGEGFHFISSYPKPNVGLPIAKSIFPNPLLGSFSFESESASMRPEEEKVVLGHERQHSTSALGPGMAQISELLDASKCRVPIPSPIPHYPVSNESPGYSLLQKSGWRNRLKGLGREEQGRFYPIQVPMKQDKRGVGDKSSPVPPVPKKRKSHRQVIQESKQDEALRRKMMSYMKQSN